MCLQFSWRPRAICWALINVDSVRSSERKSAARSRAFVWTMLAAVFHTNRGQTGGWRPAGQPEYARADYAVVRVGGSE